MTPDQLLANPDEYLRTVLNMERFGGHFASHLAKAALAADGSNKERLLDAFSGLFEKYSSHEWDER